MDTRSTDHEPLRVLSWRGGWGRALRLAVCDPFERESGIRVEQVPHVGLKLPDTLVDALHQRARPPLDVVWSNSVPALRAELLGQVAALDPDEHVVLRQLRPRAFPSRQPDGSVRIVCLYVVYYVLVYREAAFADGPPSSWSVLLDLRHRGKIALYPGGNGFYPIAQVMGGGRSADVPHALTPCWSFVRSLRPQIGQLDYSIGMERALADGALDLCFRALPNALAFRQAGVAVDWCIPREGTTDTLDALWVPAGLPEPVRRRAAQLVAFALRPDVQSRFCEALGAMPVHPDAEVPALLRARSDLPRDADDQRGILSLSEIVKRDHEPQLEARFAAIMAGARNAS